jgi:hypothetical protein
MENWRTQNSKSAINVHFFICRAGPVNDAEANFNQKNWEETFLLYTGL